MPWTDEDVLALLEGREPGPKEPVEDPWMAARRGGPNTGWGAEGDDLLAALEMRSPTSGPQQQDPWMTMRNGDMGQRPAENRGARDMFMNALVGIGETADELPFMPDFTEEGLRQNLNRLRNEWDNDKGKFARDVLGYAGDTLSSPYVSVPLAAGGAWNAVGKGATAAKAAWEAAGNTLLTQGVTRSIGEYGKAGRPDSGGATSPEVAAAMAQLEGVAKGEPLGPNFKLTKEGINDAVNSGKTMRVKGGRGEGELIPTSDKDKGVSYYDSDKANQRYAKTLDPKAEQRAMAAYHETKNNVYARYGEALKAATDPKSRSLLMEQISQEAEAEALSMIPEEFRTSALGGPAPEALEKKPPPQSEEPGFLETYGDAIGATLGAGTIAYLVAKKIITAKQVKELAAKGAGVVDDVAPAVSRYAGLSKNFGGMADEAETGIETLQRATKSADISKFASKAKSAPKGLPYLPSQPGTGATKEAAAKAKAAKAFVGEDSGPVIKGLPPEIQEMIAKANPRPSTRMGGAQIPENLDLEALREMVRRMGME